MHRVCGWLSLNWLEMDRSREVKQVSMAALASLPKRRQRGSGFRDSPDEDGPVELQETVSCRKRSEEKASGSGKKQLGALGGSCGVGFTAHSTSCRFLKMIP
uniref:Uncharacterized protein n=1 Tax=Kalanchoe fedtschenkoi TaxID=63787 RepID=A0A7N1A9E5_KALFE